MAPVLDTAFGYHLLQLGCTRGQPLFGNSPINHRIYVAERCGKGITLLAATDELPLESDSVDTVIAHHSLDFAPNPHQVLREIQRVLTPQGQLLVIGINPYSLLGLGTALRGLDRRSLWHWHSPVSLGRLTDWLHLLGCEVEGVTWVGSVPLVGGATLRRWLARVDAWGNSHNLAVGGLYMLHAVKHVPALRRPRRKWRLRRERLFGLLPGPAPAPSPSPRGRADTHSRQQRHHGDYRA
ncbi:MAG: class I SAM-dependent methyltransferase [Pseudomonadales bacterium]|nr:class I SAM-dependent methyltransferase [Halieaceae bacterium]MCP5164707.1 class I SAM-dependent methyltransferase [Pseudomonadales bacterium]MCP5188817.1 class I SAM-dependent methyltransferase [Pseudomonadales bacterium]MCP5203195.1 class I SAM-dependent methyltransferase [Pseudomonadales bacterium]